MDDNTVIEEIRPLRPRDELERSLAIQISLGVITSVEAALKDGNEDAIEYSAQMLFNDVRRSIARREKLPRNVIEHLLKDREPTIRYQIIQNHWQSLSSDIFEDMLEEASKLYKKEGIRGYYSGEKRTFIDDIFCSFEQHFFLTENDEVFLRLLKIKHDGNKKRKGTDAGWKNVKLRNMPKSCEYLFDPEESLSILNLIHPDKKIRKLAVETVCSSTIKYLRYSFRGYDKTEILQLITEDSDPQIRKYLLENMNWLPTLQVLENDPDQIIACRAKMKAAKFIQRAKYAKLYHAKKKKKPLPLP